MRPSSGNEPTAYAIGMLTFGGGALLLSELFGVWIAFTVVVAITFVITLGTMKRRREGCRHDEQAAWERILREEWGYRRE